MELTQKNSHPAYNDINNVRNYMLRNCHEKISLAHLAGMTGCDKKRTP